jgi:hypothetical protein
MLNALDDKDKARLLATQAPHSGDWLFATPITAIGLRMSNETIRVAVGIRLGTRLSESHTCPCGTFVDARGLHGLSCRRSAGRHTRHSQLNDIIWRCLCPTQWQRHTYRPRQLRQVLRLTEQQQTRRRSMRRFSRHTSLFQCQLKLWDRGTVKV